MFQIFAVLRNFIALVMALLGFLNFGQSQTTIELYSNPTSGYEWTCYSENEDVVRVVGHFYAEDSNAVTPDGGGTDRFILRGVGDGTADVRCRYCSRSDPTLVASEYVFTFSVTGGKIRAEGRTRVI